MCIKKSKNVSEEDMRKVEHIENFLRSELDKEGFRLGRRRYHKGIFWFRISKKGFLRFPNVALDIFASVNIVRPVFFERNLPEEEILKNLLKKYQELNNIQIAVEPEYVA